MAVIQRPEAVGDIQEILDKLGYETGDADGMWGKDTSAGFNHFVHDVQGHVFADQPEQRDGLYGARTHEAVQGQLEQMYGDRLSAEEIQRLSTALGQMTERVDPNGNPAELGRPLINRLHTPTPLADFESKITPRPAEVVAEPVTAPEVVVEEPVVAQPLPVLTQTEPETQPEYEEVVVNGQPVIAMPQAEPQPVQPIEAAFAVGLSDADIVADAEALTRRAAESLRYGSSSGLGGTDNGQMMALGRIADAGGDPLLTAQASTQVLGDVVANLDLQQRNLVAGNAQLADLVRAAHPDVGNTPEAVVAKLREPGVAAALLAGNATDGNMTGERALITEFVDMERERLGAVRVQGVMTAEQARLEAVAAGVDVTAEPATPPMPEEMLDRMADIERQQGELMRVNFLTGEGGASDTLVAERIANMRDPVKFERLRDHLVETGNTEGVTALDQFRALEDTRRGIQASFEGAVPSADVRTDVAPLSADQRISQAFEAASAVPVNPELQAALERKAAEMRAGMGSGPQ